MFGSQYRINRWEKAFFAMTLLRLVQMNLKVTTMTEIVT
jgi:hypothetical protein